jgi:hypothetical protein
MLASTFPEMTPGHRTRFERRLMLLRLHRPGSAPKGERDRPPPVRREPRTRPLVEPRDSKPLAS